MRLRAVEKELCQKIAHGEAFVVPPGAKPIRAEVLRHIALGLPLIAERPLKDADRTCVGQEPPKGRKCSKTSVGITLIGGTINKRLKLDAISGESGGPACPLRFEGVTFDGGFSGADGHFGHLSFSRCKFRDRRVKGKLLPSIDLSNARIESDLDMRETWPEGVPPPAPAKGWAGFPAWREEPAAAKGHHHWIRISGARVAGAIDLSGSYLRAPADVADLAERTDCANAIDMSLVEAAGDFHFREGSCAAGRIWAKSADLRGDFWLSGARLDGRGEQALVMQSATVGGMLVIDSRYDNQGCKGPFRWFSARGEINLHGLTLGGKLFIKNATILPSEDARPSTVPRSASEAGEPLPPPSYVALCLHNARLHDLLITGQPKSPATMLGLIQLVGLNVEGPVAICHLLLGKEGEKPENAILDARGLTAGMVTISHLQPAPAVDDGAAERELSIDLSHSVLKALTMSECAFSGPVIAPSLRTEGDVAIDASVAELVNLEQSTIGGNLDLSGLRVGGNQPRLALTDSSIGRVLNLRGKGHDGPGFSLPGIADLSGASCDTLDDDLGRCWGSDIRIQMNNFGYRRTGASSDRGEHSIEPKESHRVVGDWLRGRRAEGRFPWSLIPRWLLAERDGYWEPWQLRRNWIYLQYDRSRKPSAEIAQRRVHEDEFHPQPFEQAIKVARAEGHDSAATNFEILKQRIEWQHFNRLMRWGLGILAILLSAVWLIVHDPRPLPAIATLVATAITSVLMLNTSRLFAVCRRVVGANRKRAAKLVLYLIFFTPALLVLAHFWWDAPLRFVQAAMIFAAVRLIAEAAHATMRFGFGYLRRPVYAIGTLIGAFLVGWAGVATANANGMLIIETTPVVGQVQEDGTLGSPVARRLKANLPCKQVINQPLYALDILIPLLDLRQESRCTTGRAAELAGATVPRAAGRTTVIGPDGRGGFSGLISSWRQLTVGNEFFWAIAKALYAIAGWFIVSLSILTFANVQRRAATDV